MNPHLYQSNPLAFNEMKELVALLRSVNALRNDRSLFQALGKLPQTPLLMQFIAQEEQRAKAILS